MKGDELRRIRDRLAWTQTELAVRLGVTRNTVARWERGEVSIREPMVRLIKLVAKKGR
jgi:DNA-binding transcriptional regulator YiaG